jgi:RNA polymerase sigma factor (TIGR02999 family)
MANPQDVAAGDKGGNAKPSEELLPQVYAELRRLAASKLAAEAPGQTLQPTALVHEAWLRLTAGAEHAWDSRAHFFGAAAEAMRRILIDNARRKQALRHGAGQARMDVQDLEIAAPEPDERLLAIDEALDKLTAADKPKADLVKLRFFGGMTIEEAARVLGISEATAKRWWMYARAWLFTEISGERS